MHELALCRAIAGVASRHAAGRHVETVRVRIGALRQVVPESLEFCWTVVRDFAGLPDAELKLELVAAAVRCRCCSAESTPAAAWSLRCPDCDSTDVELLRGDEFLVTALDVS